jgi:hypothetical protein
MGDVEMVGAASLTEVTDPGWIDFRDLECEGAAAVFGLSVSLDGDSS